MRKRTWLLTCLLLVGSLSATVVDTAGESTKTTVAVHASVPLNDARLFIQAGDTVSIRAEGQWTVKPRENIVVGPDGETGTSALPGCELPGAPVGALLAVVSGKRYLVGSKAQITFDQSGQLFLTANTQSKLTAYLGNQGTLTVDVEVQKAAAFEINGRYSISFQEDQLVLSSGREKKVISLEQLKKEKIRNERGESVAFPENAAEHLKALSTVIQVEVKDVHVFVKDPQNPDRPAHKGIYNADRKEFLIHLEGSFKPVAGCFFLYTKNLTGRLAQAGKSPEIQGDVNLTLTLACKGPEGQQGKGKIVNLALPFTGTRMSP